MLVHLLAISAVAYVCRGWQAVPANRGSFSQRRQVDLLPEKSDESISDELLPRVALHSVYKFGWCTPTSTIRQFLAKTAEIHFPSFESTQGKYVYLLVDQQSIRFRMQCVVMKVMVPQKYLFRSSRFPIYYCQGHAYYLMLNYIYVIEVHELFLHSNLNMPADFLFEFYHPPTYDNYAKEVWHEYVQI